MPGSRGIPIFFERDPTQDPGRDPGGKLPGWKTWAICFVGCFFQPINFLSCSLICLKWTSTWLYLYIDVLLLYTWLNKLPIMMSVGDWMQMPVYVLLCLTSIIIYIYKYATNIFQDIFSQKVYRVYLTSKNISFYLHESFLWQCFNWKYLE
jgi:hypothetical protein